MSTKGPHRQQRYTIDHEGMQRVSTLGVIDPETGFRHYWCPDDATNMLVDFMRQPGFIRERYCNRCEAYDGELGIKPWQKKLPKLRRRDRLKVDPVDLPWQPNKPAADVRLNGYHKSRPGHPMELDACHMCLFSFLDEQKPPNVSPEQAEILKAAFRRERDTVARLNRAKANGSNSPALAEYILGLLERAKKRLRVAVNACRDAGFEPWRPRVVRDGDDPPDV